MYYGENHVYRRPFFMALECFIWWDIIGPLFHIHYHGDVRKTIFSCRKDHIIIITKRNKKEEEII